LGAVSSFKDNGPGKPTNSTGLQARPLVFDPSLLHIVPQILSLLSGAELSHTDMIIFSALVTNKMTPQLWVALLMFGEWITKANASGVGEAKSCLVAAYQ
jgi:hypothetical protein